MAEILLIADDDIQTLELLKSVLETKGYRVLGARDGEETLLLAKQYKPDLILMDVLMPKLNGFEVAHLLKENPEYKDTVIIFLSAKTKNQDKVTGLRMGGSDFITKPFDIYELMARIEATLRIKNVHDPVHRHDRRGRFLSLADPLTGLYQREFFMERMNEEIRRAEQNHYPVACLLMEMDRFPEVVKKFGKLQGDQVLQRLALLLKKTNRVVDMIGRFGPIQYIVQFVQTDLGGAEKMALRFLEKVKRTRMVQIDPHYRVTLSLGVAAFSGDKIGTTATIIQKAELALEQARQQGGDRVIALE